jgi:hypothetical protein
MLAQIRASALFSFGKRPTTRVRRLTSRNALSITLVDRIRFQCACGKR